MKILCLDRPLPGATFEKYQPHLLDEVRHAWQVYKKDIIREINFRQDRLGVAIIVECASVDEAQQVLADLPLVKAGLIEFDIIPLRPFAAWEALFASEHTND
jgi:N-formylglutamate amidohydrolase